MPIGRMIDSVMESRQNGQRTEIGARGIAMMWLRWDGDGRSKKKCATEDTVN